MIEFTKIIITGFCSIQELELSLNTNSITIIKGATGNGKSSIFSALVWCLYGKNIKGNSNVNTWKKFQPKKYPGTKVEVYFNTGEHVHRLVRCLRYTEEVDGAKGSNRLIYQIDGSTVEDKKKRGIQSIIEHDLGMSYTLFLNSIMFGQGLKRLIQESGSNQRELFEEVFELGYLSKAQKIAKDKYLEADGDYIRIGREHDHKVNEINQLKETLENIKSKQSSYEKDQKALINGLINKQDELLSKARKLTKELEDVNVDKLKAKLKQVNENITSAKSELNAAKDALGISLEELVDKIIKLLEKQKYADSLSELKNLKTSFKTQEVQKKKIIRLQQKASEISHDISEVNSKYQIIKSYTDRSSDIAEQIRSEKKSVPDFQSLIEDNIAKTHKLKVEAKKLANQKKIYKESSDLYRWAYTDPFGNTGIKSYLFNSCLAELNEILESYSEVLGFHVKFEVNLESARKDFVTTIQIGNQEVPFEDLSGGQKQLVSLAMAFSMNTMIGRAQGVNISFLDEVFDSLSADKVEIVTELIKKIYKGRTLFLITHLDSLPISKASILRVTNENGISRYEL